jgi:hypothetical protein
MPSRNFAVSSILSAADSSARLTFESAISTVSPSGDPSVSGNLVALTAGVVAGFVALILLAIVGFVMWRRGYTYSVVSECSMDVTSAVTVGLADALTQVNPFTIGPLSMYSAIGPEALDEAIA